MASPSATSAGSARYREAVGKLLAPDSVAVVGASPAGPGRMAVDNLISAGYTGRVGCVNPRHDSVAGIDTVATVGALGFVPEAVVLAVGPERAPSLLAQAAEAGARAAVVFALGMAATGEHGERLQERIVATARASEMAVLGPNCQGTINFAGGVALYMSPVRSYRPGRVALISQSGSVLTGLLNNRRGVRFSHAVSTGNEAVTDAADLLEAYVHDHAVDVICAYLETIRRPAAFFAQCDRAHDAGKPVIVHKAGRTAAGQAAAVAHTGALALPERLLDAALRRHRVAVVSSLDELLETAKAMQARARPRGGAVAGVTGSGGHIELLEDEIDAVDLSLPAFSTGTQARMRELLAPFLEPTNPIDWWGTPEYETRVPAIIEAAADDERIDILVEIDDYASGFVSNPDRGSQSLRRAIDAGPAAGVLRAVIDPVGGAPPPADVETALAAGVPLLSGMRDGLRALDHLVAHARPSQAARTDSELDRDAVHRRFLALAEGVSGGPAALELLTAAGLTVARGRVADSTGAALAAAAEIGYPVVAKIADDAVAHKTERGGVITAITTPAELEAAAARLLSRSGPILIQEQIDAGVELIVGLERHPLLGRFVLTGMGGVWTEVLDDATIRCAGLRVGEAREMLAGLRGAVLLDGARGRPAGDVAAAARAIELIDDLGGALGSALGELEINPLIVGPTGAVVVDALVVKRGGAAHLTAPDTIAALSPVAEPVCDR